MAAKWVTVTSSVTSLGRAVAGPGQPIHHESLGIGSPPPFLLGSHLAPCPLPRKSCSLQREVFKESFTFVGLILLLINNQSSWVCHWSSCHYFNTKAEVFGLLPPTPSPPGAVTSVSFSPGKGQLLHFVDHPLKPRCTQVVASPGTDTLLFWDVVY